MNEETLNKVDLAIEQLEAGMKLFLSGESYVSALTLAGAAEEILGMVLRIHGIQEKWGQKWGQIYFRNKGG